MYIVVVVIILGLYYVNEIMIKFDKYLNYCKYFILIIICYYRVKYKRLLRLSLINILYSYSTYLI